jgi:hypothetical protein
MKGMAAVLIEVSADTRNRVGGARQQPLGAPFAVWHFHESRRSMLLVQLPTRGLAVSRDQIVLAAVRAPVRSGSLAGPDFCAPRCQYCAIALHCAKSTNVR